jgi:DNA gyrase inhibitor GyrI
MEENMEKKLMDRDVRIIYVPPMTVASIHKIGRTPESEYETGNLVHQFIKERNLPMVKPDFRHFGFNHPNGQKPDGSDHGYERWVSIPNDMTVEQPFTKKKFSGGLYAAWMIPMGLFEEWGSISDWVEKSKKYEMVKGNPECMDGLLEEFLNYINLYTKSCEELDEIMQLDLLVQIKERNIKKIE